MDLKGAFANASLRRQICDRRNAQKQVAKSGQNWGCIVPDP